MAEKITAQAIPFEGHDQYFRAGHRFGREPVEITVKQRQPGEERKAGEFTPEEFEQLRNDPRIKLTGADSIPRPSGTQQQTDQQKQQAAEQQRQEQQRKQEQEQRRHRNEG
jgi:hypothetical protein